MSKAPARTPIPCKCGATPKCTSSVTGPIDQNKYVVAAKMLDGVARCRTFHCYSCGASWGTIEVDAKELSQAAREWLR